VAVCKPPTRLVERVRDHLFVRQTGGVRELMPHHLTQIGDVTPPIVTGLVDHGVADPNLPGHTSSVSVHRVGVHEGRGTHDLQTLTVTSDVDVLLRPPALTGVDGQHDKRFTCGSLSGVRTRRNGR
jgi:hypothetical protein